MTLGRLVEVTDKICTKDKVNTRFFLVQLETLHYCYPKEGVKTVLTEHLFTEKEIYRALDRYEAGVAPRQDPTDRKLGTYYPITYVHTNGHLVTRVSVSFDPTELWRMPERAYHDSEGNMKNNFIALFTTRELLRSMHRVQDGLVKTSAFHKFTRKVRSIWTKITGI